jgi:hypothetical protein
MVGLAVVGCGVAVDGYGVAVGCSVAMVVWL